jgi:hypothetical protein
MPDLAELAPGDEHLPIVDQLVDLIASGKEELYEAYAESRHRLFADNWHLGIEFCTREHTVRNEQTRFILLWIAFDRRICVIVGAVESQRVPFGRLTDKAFVRIREESADEPYLSEKERLLLGRARDLRNRLLHGIESGDTLVELGKAIALMAELLRRFRPHVSTER